MPYNPKNSQIISRKLSSSQIIECCKLYIEGNSLQKLSDKFNCSIEHVSHILERSNIEIRKTGKRIYKNNSIFQNIYSINIIKTNNIITLIFLGILFQQINFAYQLKTYLKIS